MKDKYASKVTSFPARESEPSPLRLQLAEAYDQLTDKQIKTLDHVNTLDLMVNELGAIRVYELLKFIALSRGVRLPDHRG